MIFHTHGIKNETDIFLSREKRVGEGEGEFIDIILKRV
jgi:hypothetical protein